MKRLQGEFERQRAVVMLFPSRNDVWRHACMPIRKLMVELANILAKHVPVVMGVLPELLETARCDFAFHSGVKLVEMRYNDCWARDSISCVVSGDVPYIASCRFNAYGGELYTPWDDDDALDETVAKEFGYPLRRCRLTLEGGNLLTDGAGTLFAVKEAIVNDNRNPGIDQKEVERMFMEITASQQIVWIDRGLEGDETGGHIDNVMALADPHTILLSFTDDVRNPHYEMTHRIEAFLKTVRNAAGEPYDIVHLPIPRLYYRTAEDSDSITVCEGSLARLEGDAVLETYVNFALANGVVVVPQFGDPLDGEALAVIAKAFPDRRVVPLAAREATLGGGGFHCLTKHIH